MLWDRDWEPGALDRGSKRTRRWVTGERAPVWSGPAQVASRQGRKANATPSCGRESGLGLPVGFDVGWGGHVTVNFILLGLNQNRSILLWLTTTPRTPTHTPKEKHYLMHMHTMTQTLLDISDEAIRALSASLPGVHVTLNEPLSLHKYQHLLTNEPLSLHKHQHLLTYNDP